MSSLLELGEFFLKHPNTNCRLQASISVQASVHSDAGNIAQNLPPADLLTSDSTWVCRGKGLRLDISLFTGPTAEEDGPLLAQFYGGLDARIREAEESEQLSSEGLDLMLKQLWKQLGLLVSLNASHQTSHISGEGRLISVNLKHDRGLVTAAKRAIHRLSVGVPHADVCPSEGVTVVGLEVIYLSFKLSTRQISSKRRRSNGPRKPAEGHRRPRRTPGSHLEALPNPGDPDPLCGPETAARSSQGNGAVATVGQSYADDELLFDDWSLVSNDGPAHSQGEVSGWTMLPTPSPSPKRKRNKTAQGRPSSSLDAKDAKPLALLELVDVALRMSIGGKPTKPLNGIEVTQQEDEARLTDIVPALFSPSFLAAISERAVFSPTISHALSHTLFSNARSAALVSKLRSIGHRSDLTRPNVPLTGSETPGTFAHQEMAMVDKEVRVSLWQIMQRRLYDPNAARRLKPLSYESQSAEARFDADEVLTAPEIPNLDDDLLDDGMLTAMEEDEADSLLEEELLVGAFEDDVFEDFDEMLDHEHGHSTMPND